MGESGFWDDNEAAQRVVSELKGLKTVVSPMNDLVYSVGDLEVLFEMAEEDSSVQSEVEVSCASGRIARRFRTQSSLNGPNDSAGAILSPMLGTVHRCQ